MSERRQGSLAQDRGNTKIQGFATKKTVAITANSAWTPNASDIAFAVSVECTCKINGNSPAATLLAGATRVIIENQTYTFDQGMVIEVM